MKLAPTLQRLTFNDPDDHRKGDEEREVAELRALLAVARAAKAKANRWSRVNSTEGRALVRALARLERVSRKP